MATVDFSQWRLQKASDLEPFMKSDPDRWAIFTKNLNDRLLQLPPGRRLYIEDIVKPKSYNATVKWFCWICFISSGYPHTFFDQASRREYAVNYTMGPDCDYIQCNHIKIDKKR